MTATAGYILRNDTAMECFGDEGILFQAADCRAVRLNRLACHVVELLQREMTEDDIVEQLTQRLDNTPHTLRIDVLHLLQQLKEQRCVKRIERASLDYRRKTMQENDRYMANPDVQCRIEDEDGAILYNPDTEGMQVINPTGLEIWETLSEPQTLAQVVEHMLSVCHEVPEEEIAQDIKLFIQQLLHNGFIGTAEQI